MMQLFVDCGTSSTHFVARFNILSGKMEISLVLRKRRKFILARPLQ
jgi:hypothetical protein